MKEIREDAEAYRKKVAMEDHMFQELLESSQMGSMEARRVSGCWAWLAQCELAF